MTFMAQPSSPGGFRTWTCGECGRLHLALALEACPECGAGRPGPQAEAPVAPVVPVAVPVPPARAARTRARIRTARGGGGNG